MAATRYFVTSEGAYWGTATSIDTADGELLPSLPGGLVEVTSRPPGDGYKWDGAQWTLVPVVPWITDDALALAFTPEQGEALISDPKILNMMLRLKARGGVPANDQTLAEVIAYVKASQLLGPDTADQIDAALGPLLGGE